MCPVIQPPNGTRDLYPIEAARRRFITEAWRRVSINHGFEEIDGPTFEHLELYTVKSGDGIVSELFSFRREGGEKDFALRPEFTPTLARMYAAKAKSLPKPTKWFTAGPFFRAERPQRGRLREFLQWNCDVIGGVESMDSPYFTADFEILTCCIGLLESLGLSPEHVRVKVNFRQATSRTLTRWGVSDTQMESAFRLLDGLKKISDSELAQRVAAHGLPLDAFIRYRESAVLKAAHPDWNAVDKDFDRTTLERLFADMHRWGIAEWCEIDTSIVRGLAYYTGMVFEVIVDGERAVAGGGRYDNLIEMFGGPSTPAVGFGMGDVVLSLVLQDKGLMPTDAELLEIAGMRPDVFVIAAENEEAQAKLGSVVAQLRRGDSVDTGQRPVPRDGKGLHVRRSYKSTKKIGKLLQEAADVRAKFAVILESGTEATVKNLMTGEQDQNRIAIDALATELRRRISAG